MGVNRGMSTHSPDRFAVKTLLDAEGLARTLSRIAHEIIERNDDLTKVALIGIHTRGVPIAERLAALIEERSGEEVGLGAVDITFYRDDVQIRGGEAPLHAQPVVRATQLDFPLEGPKTINGLLLEELEEIPEAGERILLTGHPVEIMQVQNRMVKVVRILPKPAEPAEAKAA